MVGPLDQHCLMVLLWRDTGDLASGFLFQGIQVWKCCALEIFLNPGIQPKVIGRKVWQIWRVRQVCQMELVEKLKSEESSMAGSIIHVNETASVDTSLRSEIHQCNVKPSQDRLENMLIDSEGPAHKFHVDHPLRVKECNCHHLPSPKPFLGFLWPFFITPEPLPALFLCLGTRQQ